MRTSLKAVLSRVDRLARRGRSEQRGDWDKRVEVLKSARAQNRAGTVAPEISPESLRALHAWAKAMRRR